MTDINKWGMGVFSPGGSTTPLNPAKDKGFLDILKGMGVDQMSAAEQAQLQSFPAPEEREASPEELAVFTQPAPQAKPVISAEVPPKAPATPPKQTPEEKKAEPQQPKAAPEAPLFTFTDMEKLAFADALVSPEEAKYVYKVKINSILTVGFKLITDVQKAVVNRAVQQANARGLLRRRKTRLEAMDEQGRPVLQEVDGEVAENADSTRAIRLAELSVYLDNINGKKVSDDAEEARELLEKYPSITLDLIYMKGLLKFFALQKEVETNFENF